MAGSDQGVLAGGASILKTVNLHNKELSGRNTRHKHSSKNTFQLGAQGTQKIQLIERTNKEHVALNRESYYSPVLLMLKRVRWSVSCAVLPRLSKWREQSVCSSAHGDAVLSFFLPSWPQCATVPTCNCSAI